MRAFRPKKWRAVKSQVLGKRRPLFYGGRNSFQTAPTAQGYFVDSFEWNKIFGWLLAAAIAVLGLGIATGFAFPQDRPETMGYLPCGEEGCVTEEAGDEGDGISMEDEIALALQEADPAKGANVFKKCATCHTVEQGGPNKQGPNLWGVVGRPIGSHAGFSYSDAMASHGGNWTFEMLNEYIANPKAAIPGNIMAFAGISRAADRADLFAYLNELGSNLPYPAPPEPAAEGEGEDGAAVEGEEGAAEGEGEDPEGTGPEEGKAPDVPAAEEEEAARVPNSNVGGPAAENQDTEE
ncbi:c-type cytochrome [Pacificimonas sp. ICDLI1SI03]